MIVLRIIESADGWRVEHVPSGERLATFRSRDGAEKFIGDIAELDWRFSDPLMVPMATWAGLCAAFSRRGIEIKPNWKLRENA